MPRTNLCTRAEGSITKRWLDLVAHAYIWIVSRSGKGDSWFVQISRVLRGQGVTTVGIQIITILLASSGDHEHREEHHDSVGGS